MMSKPMTVEITTTTGTTHGTNVVVKNNGWVKYQKDGEIHHLPPHRVKSIHERNPEQPSDEHEYVSSDVTYTSPHGRV